MPWWGYLIMWFGIAIIIIWLIAGFTAIRFAAKQAKRMEEDQNDFFSKRF